MPEIDTYRTADGAAKTRVVKGKDETGAVAVADKMKNTSLVTKAAGGADMPKPGPGEDAMSPAYRARLRSWRESRGTAVTEMMKK